MRVQVEGPEDRVFRIVSLLSGFADMRYAG